MSEIERQFFEAFEIDNCRTCDYHGLECWECDDTYPQITDRTLLKLICLMGNTDYFLITNEGLPINIEGLKDSVLHSLTIYSKFHKGLKEEVQAIFKEQ